MDITIRQNADLSLAEYARIPIAFEVCSVLDVSDRAGGLEGLTMSERRLALPTTKDYDAIPGQGPLHWGKRFDLSHWSFFSAHARERALVGAAAVVMDAASVRLCQGRSDLAVLWDIRVAPHARGQGVGSALVDAIAAWSTARGARQVMVETQNVNVPACRFYASYGFTLGGIQRFAYSDFPDEVQLLWYLTLDGRRSDSEPTR